MTRDLPTEGDLIRITFDRENGIGEPVVDGRVTEVDTEPETVGKERFVRVDEGDKELHYYEGTLDGEAFAVVSRYSEFSGSTHLGDNAEYEIL